MSARIEVTIPLEVTITLSVGPADLHGEDSSLSRQTQRLTMGGYATTGTPLTPDLRLLKENTLRDLQQSQSRIYFDEEQDIRDIGEYYRNVMLGDREDENFATLSRLLDATHTSKPAYSPATQLYPWVDLHKVNGRLLIESIYSGQVFDAEDCIDDEFSIKARRENVRRWWQENERYQTPEHSAIEELLDMVLPYNCEHVVPQSWFSRREPSRGDLHHLFACEAACNSFRGNSPYSDFSVLEAERSLCGRLEDSGFEPSAGKGAVARATLYFLTRYPGSIDLGMSRMNSERVHLLLNWSERHPVTEYERHRNQAIFQIQKNRNPFVDTH